MDGEDARRERWSSMPRSAISCDVRGVSSSGAAYDAPGALSACGTDVCGGGVPTPAWPVSNSILKALTSIALADPPDEGFTSAKPSRSCSVLPKGLSGVLLLALAMRSGAASGRPPGSSGNRFENWSSSSWESSSLLSSWRPKPLLCTDSGDEGEEGGGERTLTFFTTFGLAGRASGGGGPFCFEIPEVMDSRKADVETGWGVEMEREVEADFLRKGLCSEAMFATGKGSE